MPSTSEPVPQAKTPPIKVLMVAGPKGGVGRTTLCVRLAEQFKSRGIAPVLVDLTPNPTAQLLVKSGSFPIAQGRGASSITAARAVMRPYEESAAVAILDTSRLDDPLLEPWAGIATHLIVATSANPQGLGSLRAIWDSMQRLRSVNPALDFVGILPMMARPEDMRLLDVLRARPDVQMLSPCPSFSEAERDRLSARALDKADMAVDSRDPVIGAYSALADRLVAKMGLRTAAPAAASAPATGVLGKLWRMAAKAIGPRATAVEARA